MKKKLVILGVVLALFAVVATIGYAQFCPMSIDCPACGLYASYQGSDSVGLARTVCYYKCDYCGRWWEVYK